MTETKIPEISIVVAVYKAEAYIRRCLDSILAQTFADYEVIMVDDGSPDRSGEICEEYVRRDQRFKVVHKENGGVGSARKVGMEHSRGRYSSHIDPDDWVEPTFLELLHKAAEENNADIAICNMVKEYGGDNSEVLFPTECSKDITSEVKIGDKVKLEVSYHAGLANKLVKMNLYKIHNIQFINELRWGEDTEIYFKLLAKAKKIYYVSDIFYHYDRISNRDSLTRHMKDSREYMNHRLMFMGQVNDILDEKSKKKLIGLIAHEWFYYDYNHTFSNKEFLKIFGRYKRDIFSAKIDIWKKINILSTFFGLNRISRPIYIFMKRKIVGQSRMDL